MPTPPQPQPLRLAELLSDLVSLRVSSPAAALALVSARATTTPSSTAPKDEYNKNVDGKNEDAEIRRAKELVELHYAVKEAHRRGELGAGLEDARAKVERAVWG